MAEPSPRKGKLTLRDLQSVRLDDAAAPAVSAEPAADELAALLASPPAGGEASQAPSGPAKPVPPRPSRITGSLQIVDAADHLPDGVSSDVASILGMPSREQAEASALGKLAEQIAAAEASAAKERAARAAAEEAERRSSEERATMQRALQEAGAAEQRRIAADRRRTKMLAIGGGTVTLALVATLAVILVTRPPPLDQTVYVTRDVQTISYRYSAEGMVAFDPIPIAPPPVVEEAPARRNPAARTGGGRRPAGREAVRARDLF